ncbi:MAG: trypsin-like peptidase domain-containing protein [Myxococcales bacterium]|nr:trypsin-like peptidase domain-containing protein [Myxococcales bacterium]
MTSMMVCWLWSSLGFAAERRTPVVVAVERATPAVVAIDVEVVQQNPFGFFGPRSTASQGSGVVIRPDGVVLTNAHVVDGARSVAVRMADGRRYDAAVMAMESDLDLAVLKLEGASKLPTAPIGDSSELLLGETVIAIGNPLGLGLTVSTGVVSSIARDVEIKPGLHQSFVQTDAAINPGNSGGALVDINGALIGINTAIRADAEGIGFAIPVNRAMKIAADLVTHGSIQAPWLGCSLVDVSTRTRRSVVMVHSVDTGGPATALRRGDMVLQVDGHTVASRVDLNARLADRKPGARVALTVERDGRRVQVPVTSTSLPDDIGATIAAGHLGVQLTATQAGVQVARATSGGAWTRAKLRAGDVIVAIDGKRMRRVGDVHDALSRARGRHRATALFTLRRGQSQGHVELPLG